EPVDGVQNYYPFRLGMKTRAIINKKYFTITVHIVKDNERFTPRFSCECKEKSGEIYNNPTSAISSLYHQLFGTMTKFSSPLIMGFEDKEILTKLLFDIPFRPFSFKLDKLHIFVYSIGISNMSDNSCLYGAGPGFNSSFIYYIKKNGKSTSAVFTQEIEKTGCFINIYIDNQLFKRIEGVDPDTTWKQTGFLKQYKGNALFGLEHHKSQERLAKARKLYCPPKEWFDKTKIDKLFNYHLRKRISGHIDCLNDNPIGSNGKRRILSIISDSFSYEELQSKLH
ncbi:17232_t:CDS:2, partial [Gigaspora margarita]